MGLCICSAELKSFLFRFILVLFVAAVAYAAPIELDCKARYNVSFGPSEERITTCEFKYVKYSAGKILRFSNRTIDLAYQQLRIKVSESNIQAVPTVIFDEFRKLEILEMNEVGLRNIFPESFSRADALRVLQAYGNKLTLLRAFSFSGALNLEALDLSSNLITNVNFKAFSGLEKLRELGLSNNRISILDEQTFHPLTNLTWIWLDRNEIKIIAVNLLVNSQKLEGIYLNDNKISALSPILFDKLPELKFLFLMHNNCTSQDFVNSMIPKNANVKKELSACFQEFRTIVPDEEEKFKFKNVLRDAEKANAQCETDKATLLERLESTRQQLANLQYKNGK